MPVFIAPQHRPIVQTIVLFSFLLITISLNAQQPDSTRQQNLRELVVVGNFPAYLKAIQSQRAATGVVSVLNLDLPGRFPDLNPAEALQRLPGVVVQRSAGEGRFIHIRGADPSLTTVQVNGAQIISPEAKSRFLQFDLLPVDQLGAVEVYKTNLPDQDGDAIGGSINLLTKKSSNGPPVWRAALAGGFNPQAGQPNGQAQLAYSGHHFLLNASIWQDHRASDNLEVIYGERDFGQGNELWINSLELRSTAIARRRVGLSGEYVLPFQQESGQAFFRALYADFFENNLRQRLRYRPEKGTAASATDTIFGAQIGRDIQHAIETERFVSLQTGAEKSWKRWTLDAAAAYSYGLESEPEGQSLDFQLHDVDLLRVDQDAKFPQYRITNGRSENEYSNYTLNELELEDEQATDQSLTTRVNARLQLHQPADFLKFGAKARFRHKKSRGTEEILDEYTGTTPPQLPDLIQNAGKWSLLKNRYAPGQPMDWDKTREIIATEKGNFRQNVLETITESAAGNFDVRENTIAVYGMAHAERGKWAWTGGLRLEQTQYQYAADQSIVDTGVQVIPLGRTFSGQYTFLLPTLAVKYNADHGIQWRAVIGSSYARPGFDQIAPYELFNQQDAVVIAGNPDLKPSYAWNADITLEKKLHHGGSVSVAVFGKRIHHFILTQQSSETRLWNGNNLAVLKTSPINGETAWLTGLELGWQQQLQFLPGAWSGLGIYANYTFTWSRALLEEEENGVEEAEGFQLPGQSPHSGNLAIWYDHRRWSGRIALNVQSDFLLQAAEPEDAALQLIYAGSTQLDVNLACKISAHWTLFGEGMNLLNTPLQYYTGNLAHRSKLEYYGAWGRLGVKMVW